MNNCSIKSPLLWRGHSSRLLPCYQLHILKRVAYILLVVRLIKCAFFPFAPQGDKLKSHSTKLWKVSCKKQGRIYLMFFGTEEKHFQSWYPSEIRYIAWQTKYIDCSKTKAMLWLFGCVLVEMWVDLQRKARFQSPSSVSSFPYFFEKKQHFRPTAFESSTLWQSGTLPMWCLTFRGWAILMLWYPLDVLPSTWFFQVLLCDPSFTSPFRHFNLITLSTGVCTQRLDSLLWEPEWLHLRNPAFSQKHSSCLLKEQQALWYEGRDKTLSITLMAVNARPHFGRKRSIFLFPPTNATRKETKAPSEQCSSS